MIVRLWRGLDRQDSCVGALWYELCDRNGRLEWGFCKGSQTGTSAVVIIVLAPLLCFSEAICCMSRQYTTFLTQVIPSCR